MFQSTNKLDGKAVTISIQLTESDKPLGERPAFVMVGLPDEPPKHRLVTFDEVIDTIKALWDSHSETVATVAAPVIQTADIGNATVTFADDDEDF